MNVYSIINHAMKQVKDITYRNSAETESLFPSRGSCHTISYGPSTISLLWYLKMESLKQPPDAILQHWVERLPDTFKLQEKKYQKILPGQMVDTNLTTDCLAREFSD